MSAGARFVAAVSLLLGACAAATTPPVTVRAAKDFGAQPVRVLAVMPALAAEEAGRVPSDAAAVVTEILLDVVGRERRWALADPDKVAEAARSLSEKDPVETRAAVLGVKTGADATLVTIIKKFRERVGGDYGAQSAASVAFTMWLVTTKDQAVVWTADYAFTQQPLAYNLWNFWAVARGGPKWLTAAELIRIGAEEAISRLRPSKR